MHIYKELTLFHKFESIFFKHKYQNGEVSNSEKTSKQGLAPSYLNELLMGVGFTHTHTKQQHPC